MNHQTRDRQSVQSVERAFAILRTFTPERPILSVSEIAIKVGLNRTTTHRLLSTLEKCGVVRRDGNYNGYTVSAQVLQFGNVFFQLTDVRAAALDTMTRLRDWTGQTAALHVREGYFRITIAQVESTQDLRVTYPDLGVRIPLHLGAPGKAILAFLPQEELDSFFDHVPLTRATQYSVTDPDRLKADLCEVRRNGYALTRQERRPGVVSIAASVFDRGSKVVASINVSGSIHRIDESQFKEFIPLVVSAAAEVSERLGYANG
jgi:IclR family transcriptional regulator, acetate operon repressor